MDTEFKAWERDRWKNGGKGSLAVRKEGKEREGEPGEGKVGDVAKV